MAKNEQVHFNAFLFTYNQIIEKKSYLQFNIDAASITETMPKLPLMYIEVSSVDSWERYRLEGYGYTAIPATPGKHTGAYM